MAGESSFLALVGPPFFAATIPQCCDAVMIFRFSHHSIVGLQHRGSKKGRYVAGLAVRSATCRRDACLPLGRLVGRSRVSTGVWASAHPFTSLGRGVVNFGVFLLQSGKRIIPI